MSEDPKTKLLLELITKEVVMPTKHPEPISSISIFLRFKSHKILSHAWLISYRLLALLWHQQHEQCPGGVVPACQGNPILEMGTDHFFNVVFVQKYVLYTHQRSCQTL